MKSRDAGNRLADTIRDTRVATKADTDEVHRVAFHQTSLPAAWPLPTTIHRMANTVCHTHHTPTPATTMYLLVAAVVTHQVWEDTLILMPRIQGKR